MEPSEYLAYIDAKIASCNTRKHLYGITHVVLDACVFALITAGIILILLAMSFDWLSGLIIASVSCLLASIAVLATDLVFGYERKAFAAASLASRLQKEKNLWQMQAGSYKEGRIADLTEKCESLMSESML